MGHIVAMGLHSYNLRQIEEQKLGLDLWCWLLYPRRLSLKELSGLRSRVEGCRRTQEPCERHPEQGPGEPPHPCCPHQCGCRSSGGLGWRAGGAGTAVWSCSRTSRSRQPPAAWPHRAWSSQVEPSRACCGRPASERRAK